jgi:hypothetical protein
MQTVDFVNLGLFDNKPLFSQNTKDRLNNFDFNSASSGLTGIATGIGGAIAIAKPEKTQAIESGVAVTGNLLGGLG